jgi:hypothetical protein
MTMTGENMESIGAVVPDGDRWGARLEIYESDPAQEPDMDKWVTDLAFRLAG